MVLWTPRALMNSEYLQTRAATSFLRCLILGLGLYNHSTHPLAPKASDDKASGLKSLNNRVVGLSDLIVEVLGCSGP